MEPVAGTAHNLSSKVLGLTPEHQPSEVPVSALDLTVNVTFCLEQNKDHLLCMKVEGTSVDFSPSAVECSQRCSYSLLGFFLQRENLRVTCLNCLECLEHFLLEFSLKKKKKKHSKLFSSRNRAKSLL